MNNIRLSELPASSELFWPQFGQRLATLGAQQAEDPARLFDDCQQLATLLTTAASTWPALLPACFSLNPTAENTHINRLIKQLSLLLIWQRQKRWQPQQSLALLSGTLYIGLCRLRRNPHTETLKLSDILTGLQPLPQAKLVISLLRGCQLHNATPLWKTALISRYLLLSMKLAAQIHPDNQSPQALEQCLANGIYHTSDEMDLALLQQLGRYSRALYLTARTATDARQQLFFLTGLVTGSQCQVYRYHPQTISETAEWLELATLQLQPPQPALPPTLLRRLPDELLPQISQDNPLLSIIRNKVPLPRTLAEQLQYLQQHPELSSVVTGYARKLNRQQQTITGLKHAVSLIGQDALPAIIAEARLQQACLQLVQPHHHWLLQLVNCLQQALHQLNAGQALPAPAELAVITWCLAGPLWLNNALSYSAAVSATGQLQVARYCIRQLWQSSAYPEQAKALLLYHGYPDWALAVTRFRQADTGSQPDGRLAAILHCAWYSACQSLFAAKLPEPDLGRQLQALGYTTERPADWLYQILAHTQACCPLAPEM